MSSFIEGNSARHYQSSVNKKVSGPSSELESQKYECFWTDMFSMSHKSGPSLELESQKYEAQK